MCWLGCCRGSSSPLCRVSSIRCISRQWGSDPFRNKSIDIWQRKSEVNTGAAVKRSKLLAFNQNISDQVATYMRDPCKMIRGMQMMKGTVHVLGVVYVWFLYCYYDRKWKGKLELRDW
ncbi:hypothetical protein Droror1_Dr00005557 [Drosera rotundifolia]